MRVRMTLLASVIMTALCGGICALILIGVHDRVVNDLSDRLLLYNMRVVRLVEKGQVPPVLSSRKSIFLQVVDPGGRVTAASPQLAGRPRLTDLVPPDDSSRVERKICDAPGFPDTCLRVVAVRIAAAGGEWIVYGAGPTTPWYVSRSLLLSLLAGSGLVVGATIVGAYRTVSKTLLPVEDICTELAEITSSDLGRRVPVPPHRDEIHKLAVTVNQTLDRLEAAVERERRFASDASHDLRSPITAMRTQVEEALLHPEESDWPSVAGAVLASLGRLQAIVTDLLVLSRLEAGAGGPHARVDLGELVGSELARHVHRTPVETRLEPGVLVDADRMQLVRLLTNLVDNADRHAESAIVVTVRSEDGRSVLEVLDDGPGIPPEQREYVFRRFARLDAARSKDKGGTGLGLAICREIAERHGGTLTIRDSGKGARFVASFPACPAGQ
ncbi:HAMP domain-containing sensor histidine kinase [Streptosporangium sandarakinum]